MCFFFLFFFQNLMGIVWLIGYSTNSRHDFGAEVAGEEVKYRGLAIHLVAANTRSNSMVYIGKPMEHKSNIQVTRC